MLAATRETFIASLLSLSQLINAYQRHDPDFVGNTNALLLELERSLQQLRSPLTALVARERGRITAALDGYGEPALQQSRLSRQKQVRVTTSLALAEIETALNYHVRTIDEKFDTWREKLAQFVSVASNSHPIPLPPTEPRNT